MRSEDLLLHTGAANKSTRRIHRRLPGALVSSSLGSASALITETYCTAAQKALFSICIQADTKLGSNLETFCWAFILFWYPASAGLSLRGKHSSQEAIVLIKTHRWGLEHIMQKANLLKKDALPGPQNVKQFDIWSTESHFTERFHFLPGVRFRHGGRAAQESLT